jgi:hypothetical protein
MRRRSPQDERSKILLAHLRSRDPKREEYVRTALAEMDQDEAVKTLLDCMERARRSLIWMPVYVVCVILSSWATITLVDRMFGHPTSFPGGAIGSAVSTTLITIIATRRFRNRILRFLATYDDKRILNVLVETIRYGDTNASRAAETPLIRILPMLRPCDERILTPKSRTTLNQSLLESTYPPRVNAILSAWEQVGDHDSIPFVERLSRGEGALGGVFSIRHAAAEALPAIREAANRTAISETLLRAASADESPTVLLRPASSAKSPEQALLRPTAD